MDLDAGAAMAAAAKGRGARTAVGVRRPRQLLSIGARLERSAEDGATGRQRRVNEMCVEREIQVANAEIETEAIVSERLHSARRRWWRVPSRCIAGRLCGALFASTCR